MSGRCMRMSVVAAALAASCVLLSAAPAQSARPTSGSSSAATSDDAASKARRFWVKDKHFYGSPWYAGRHRKMVAFGCTSAPYYDPSPLCRRDRGFHHGLDVAMRCGTRLYAGLRGRVVQPDSPGALGPAYGGYAFRLRNQRFDADIVIGHVRRVYVEPGDLVERGDLIARASDEGAPDGCHLHFEVRPKRASYDSAVNPRDFIRLHRR